MTTDIDLDYRPTSYFRPEGLDSYLLSQVKGSVLRERLKAHYDAGHHDEVRALLNEVALSDPDIRALESIHPMYMGGNYLPGAATGEVEIARITIASTTFDVACVFARPKGEGILYRVVDEYGGECLQKPTKARSKAPMTLGKLAHFFCNAYQLMEILDTNFDGDQKASLNFFTASSEFYPDLDRLLRQWTRERFPDFENDDEDEDRDE